MATTKISCILKQRRNELGLTPQDVIASLKERGIEIKEKALYAYENGDNSPKVNTFIALCDIYKISDIMGEFGYSTQGCTVPLATKDNEWSVDQYNDFFRGSLHEKLYFLIKHGVPSFAGYEKQLEKCFPTNAVAANFAKLYNYFLSLDEHAQGVALENMQILVESQHPTISEKDLVHIYNTMHTPINVLQQIATRLQNLSADELKLESALFRNLDQLNKQGLENLVAQSVLLVKSGQYKKTNSVVLAHEA